ncbi:MAG: hypothetical protein AB1603_03730 [Chloroflexota bacterium]
MGRRDDERTRKNPGADIGETEQAMAQLASEAAALTGPGKMDADIANQRNELLWKIAAQIDDTKLSLEELEATEKRLKKYLNQLQALKKILSG